MFALQIIVFLFTFTEVYNFFIQKEWNSLLRWHFKSKITFVARDAITKYSI